MGRNSGDRPPELYSLAVTCGSVLIWLCPELKAGHSTLISPFLMM